MKIKALALTTLLLGSSAFAKGNYGIHVGAGIPSDILESEMGIGVGGSAEALFGSFGLGVFATYQKVALKNPIAGASLVYLPFGATGNLHMGPFYAGGNFGQMRLTATTTQGSVTGADNFFGGQAGFDFNLSGRMSFGLEARYMKVQAGVPTSLIQGVAQLKFWH